MTVDDEDAVPSQEDRPPGVKKQVPSVRDMTVQVDQLQRICTKVPPGQLSGTLSVKTMAMQADLPQYLPEILRTDNPQ